MLTAMTVCSVYFTHCHASRQSSDNGPRCRCLLPCVLLWCRNCALAIGCIVLWLMPLACNYSPHSVAKSDALHLFVRKATVFDQPLRLAIWSESSSVAMIALEESLLLLSDLERVISFQGDTVDQRQSLAKVNQQLAVGQSVQLEPILAHAISTGLNVFAWTDGWVDLTIGPIRKLWGFYEPSTSIRAMPHYQAVESAALSVDGRAVLLDLKSQVLKVSLDQPLLDLSDIQRGYALDQVKQRLQAFDISSGSLELGDCKILFGPVPAAYRLYHVRHPYDHGERLLELRLDSGASCGTHVYERSQIWQKTTFANVFNPKKGWPIKSLATVAVWAPSALLADAWATAMFATGVDLGRSMSRQRKDVSVVWVSGQPELGLQIDRESGMTGVEWRDPKQESLTLESSSSNGPS